MIILMITYFLTIPIPLFSQDKILGRYRDYFGSGIQLDNDNTFKYTWAFDLSASWTKGTWTIIEDTLYLHMTPIYDTFSQTNKNGVIIDTLVLSSNEISERISQTQFVTGLISSGGQNRKLYPEKLVFRKGRLYKIQNGKLVTKKQRVFWTNEKRAPWFFKSED